MKKLISHSETEYNFCAEYVADQHLDVGDVTTSPVIDDNQTIHSFLGLAVVTAWERNSRIGFNRFLYYYRTYPAVI
jgi:hypothetical protein